MIIGISGKNNTEKITHIYNSMDTVHKSQKDQTFSTQRYLTIAEIHDNTIVLKDGSLRAVLQTSSVNFNLKSEDEQNSIIYSYQNLISYFHLLQKNLVL